MFCRVGQSGLFGREGEAICSLWEKGQTEKGERTGTDFLCFFSRSWLRLCRPSRWSLVSCSSAVIFWHFFFSCCTERCTSSLSVCRSAICSVQTNTRAFLLFLYDSSMHIIRFVYLSVAAKQLDLKSAICKNWPPFFEFILPTATYYRRC